jgi:hypothetical protein
MQGGSIGGEVGGEAHVYCTVHCNRGGNFGSVGVQGCTTQSSLH